jgi:hypothetical protein
MYFHQHRRKEVPEKHPTPHVLESSGALRTANCRQQRKFGQLRMVGLGADGPANLAAAVRLVKMSMKENGGAGRDRTDA